MKPGDCVVWKASAQGFGGPVDAVIVAVTARSVKLLVKNPPGYEQPTRTAWVRQASVSARPGRTPAAIGLGDWQQYV